VDEYLPATQSVHKMVDAANFPAAQATQVEDPVGTTYWPEAQAEQTVEAAAEYSPVAQATHSAELEDPTIVAMKSPAAQLVQLAWPTAVW